MKVEVLLFARLREACGRSRTSLDLRTGADASECFARLVDEFPHLKDLREGVVVAINEDYAAWGDHLADGDTIAFIPPVSGG